MTLTGYHHRLIVWALELHDTVKEQLRDEDLSQAVSRRITHRKFGRGAGGGVATSNFCAEESPCEITLLRGGRDVHEINIIR